MQMPEGSVLGSFGHFAGFTCQFCLQFGKLNPVMPRLDRAIRSLWCARIIDMIDFIDLHCRAERRYIRFSTFVCLFFPRFHRVCLAFFVAADGFFRPQSYFLRIRRKIC